MTKQRGAETLLKFCSTFNSVITSASVVQHLLYSPHVPPLIMLLAIIRYCMLLRISVAAGKSEYDKSTGHRTSAQINNIYPVSCWYRSLP